ncbi:Na(+)/H(+) antiporter subunit C [Corynebacterium freiburgense]|uniref:Na(+)/H(+) antiporter subunit C n=1 Tax=Corynebacterium freiburgense TaxID=556548 RepID=UPI0004220519|nr:Na(+)/H(+) antiporter subunit C [Corynebacterium freiburgense]WJZ03718.1 Na(+)/H(+) antiporter subunit C [Corynebacterium freiburgense]
MVANFFLLLTCGVLVASGAYLLLDRAMTRMLLGLLLMGNGLNLLMLTAGGKAGAPPIQGRNSALIAQDSDPLAQGMILTAIVISMAMTAFILALAYRQYRYRTADLIDNDSEDTALATRTTAAAPDRDASDDPLTGKPTASGDKFGPECFEAPVEKQVER